MSKAITSALFSVPKPPSRTAVPDAQAEAFVHSETSETIPPIISSNTLEPKPKAGMARLSVDIPCAKLRALRIHAATRDTTIRDLVLGLLDREGLTVSTSR